MQPVAQAYLQQHRLSVARALLGCLETLLDRTPGLSLHSWRHQCHELFPAANHLSRPDVLNKQALWSMSSQWQKNFKQNHCRVVELWRPEKKLNLGRTQLRNSTMVLFQKFFPHWELRNCGIEELRNLKFTVLKLPRSPQNAGNFALREGGKGGAVGGGTQSTLQYPRAPY